MAFFQLSTNLSFIVLKPRDGDQLIKKFGGDINNFITDAELTRKQAMYMQIMKFRTMYNNMTKSTRPTRLWVVMYCLLS